MRLKIIPNQDLKEFRTPDQLSDLSISIESLKLMKTWLSACDKDHSQCKHESTGWLPTRLVNVGAPDSTLSPHLCDSSSLSKRTRYLTLSHCWGGKPVFCLLNRNIVELQQSIPFDQLPRTFQQAIHLTRALGFQYLWIDSLCILQDSDSDWVAESMTMGDVYINSCCNIAATGAASGEIGLSFKRNSSAIRPLEIRIPAKPQNSRGVLAGSYYCMDDFWLEGVVEAPLNKRAWVFQERLLSHRVLNFGSEQVFWECKEVEACELFPTGIPPPFATRYKRENGFYTDEITTSQQAPSREVLLKAWCDAVTTYTSGKLTKQSDKLVAISGPAQKMQRLLSSEYLAGLWQVGMPGQLLWYVDHDLGRMRNRIGQMACQAPSWSWASMDGDVKFAQNAAWMESLAEYVEGNVKLLKTGEFGAISESYLRIRGHLSQAEFVLSDELLSEAFSSLTYYCSLLRSEEGLTVGLGINPDAFPDTSSLPLWVWHANLIDVRKGLGCRIFFILPLCRTSRGCIFGLILRRTESSGQFERIGMFSNDQNDHPEDEQAPILTHRPALDPDDFEKYDSESGHYTITLV